MLTLDTSDQIHLKRVTYLVGAAAAVYYAGKGIKKAYDFWSYCQAVKDLPGPKPHFLWGNIKDHPFRVDPENPLQYWFVLLKQYEDHPLFRMWFGPTNCVAFLITPEAVRDILKSDEPKALGFGAPYRIVQPWLGNGLIVANGAHWFRNRRLLTPAFHFDILKPYIDINNEATDLLLEKWRQVAEDGGVVRVFNDISLLTLDIILKCAFSSQDTVQTESSSEYVKKLKDIARAFIVRQLNPFYYPDFIYLRTAEGRKFVEQVNFVHGVALDVIEKRRNALSEGAESRERHLDFLDILLTCKDEDGIGLSDIDIRDEVNTFLFAGHDTTASAISWIMYALATHPECQETLRQEVTHIQAGSSHVKWEDLGRFTYLTMCVKEALRCYSPVPFISRVLSKDMVIGGLNLPEGTRVTIPLYLMHHNHKVWGEDHLEFKPERFAPDKQNVMDPFSFVPFSAGPRNCIGQTFAMHEIKVAVIKIVQRFHLALAPGQKIVAKAEVVLRVMDDIQLNVSPIT